MQQPGVQGLHGGQAGKAAVRLAAEHRLLQLRIFHKGQQLELNMGVYLPKGLQQVRQPLDGHAAEGGHPHQARVQTPEVGGLLLQAAGVVPQGLDIGQQSPAIGGEGHAAAVSDEQRHPQLALQGGHGVADPGLGEVQLLRRPGKAPAGRHRQKNLVFCHAHGAPPPFEAVEKSFRFFRQKVCSLLRA